MISLYECNKANSSEFTPSQTKALQSEECKKEPIGITVKGSVAALAQSACHWNELENLDTSDPSITLLYKKDGEYPITKGKAASLSSYYAQRHNGKVKKGSFIAKLQSAADRNEHYKEIDAPVIGIMKVQGPHPIPMEYARNLQSRTAHLNEGKVAKGSPAALAQSAVARQMQIQKEEQKKNGIHFYE